MSTHALPPRRLAEYITALHEAAHAFVAHKSEHWKINDPAVTFPDPSSGHLARAHFGPKVWQPALTTEHVREMIKIGFAGFHGQNLIDEQSLLSVLHSHDAGCDDDFSGIAKMALDTGIECELNNLDRQSRDLVRGNSDTIKALASAISNAAGDVSRSDLLRVLGDDVEDEPALPCNSALIDQASASSGLFGWLRAVFARKK